MNEHAKELRDQIIAADDFETIKHEVPEWGIVVWIKEMSSADRLEWQRGNIKLDDEGNWMVDDEDTPVIDYEKSARSMKESLLVRCLVDEQYERIFQDEDTSLLSKKNARIIDELYAIAADLNKLTEKDSEESEKNLQPSSSVASVLN